MAGCSCWNHIPCGRCTPGKRRGSAHLKHYEPAACSPTGHIFSLYDSTWDPIRKAAINRYYIIDAETGEVTRHMESLQAYSDGEYEKLLVETGFTDVRIYHCPSAAQPMITREIWKPSGPIRPCNHPPTRTTT